jgi:hypothetical protein
MTKRDPKRVFDSSGNEFNVVGFTKSLDGVTNGFRLQNSRGEKEVSLSEFKFFSNKKRR